MLAPQRVARARGRKLHEIGRLLQFCVLSDGDVLHLGGHDSPARVGELRNARPRLRLEYLAGAPVEELDWVAAPFAFGLLPVLLREVAVVDGLHLAPGDLDHVSPFADPALAQGGKPQARIAVER